MDQKPAPTIRELYPNLSEKELAEAEENLDQYLLVILRIFERLERESEDTAENLTNPIGTLPYTPPASASAA